MKEGERDLIKLIKYKAQSIGGNTPLYIATGFMKIRKPNIPNLDQKQTLNSIWKPSRGLTLSNGPTGLLTCRQNGPVCTTPDSREKPVDMLTGLRRQTKQTAAPVGVSTYLLHPNTSCKRSINTKELKKTPPLRLYTLSTILHLGEHFSNLS